MLRVLSTLNNAALTFVGSSLTPVTGQTFIIVDNDGTDAITGTFAGLPEGATISNFLGSSLNAAITYVGGTGNDVVLTVLSPCINPTIPTLTATVNPTCSGNPTTLSIQTGNLNSATNWQWYSGSCGGTSVGSGTSVSVSPGVTTTYYARGEGGCVNQTATQSGDCNDNDDAKWQSASLYTDNDEDGYDAGQATVCYGAAIPSGYSETTSGTDCDDNNASAHATETWYLDADNDGHYVSSQSNYGSPGVGYNQTATTLGDCDDNDNTKWQSASLYTDNDDDGYDVGQATVCYGAAIPTGYSETTSGTDCDDNNASVHTTATWYLDADNDGHYVSSQSSCGSPGTGYNQTATQSGDCDDNDNTKWQSASLYIDNDGDGYDVGQATVCYGAAIPSGYSETTSGTDCDDNNASAHATATW